MLQPKKTKFRKAQKGRMKGFSQSSIKPKSAWRVGLLATRDH